jgi:hypothetical protein
MEAKETTSEASAEEVIEDQPEETLLALEPMMPGMGSMLQPQLDQVNSDIKMIRAEIEKVKAKAEVYQKRVEDTPKRQQELVSLKRDYANLKQLYDSLLNRKLESDIAVSMEKKQKGEQFRVIDPAKTPEVPVEPDVRRILMLTLLFGIGLGGGLAYLVEMMDKTYGDPEDLENDLKLPILIAMPIRHTSTELKRMKLKQVLTAASVAAVFAFSAVGLVLGIKGLDATILFIKNLLAI